MDGETSLYLVTENGLLNVTTKMEHIKIKKVEKEWSLSAIFYGGNQHLNYKHCLLENLNQLTSKSVRDTKWC